MPAPSRRPSPAQRNALTVLALLLGFLALILATARTQPDTFYRRRFHRPAETLLPDAAQGPRRPLQRIPQPPDQPQETPPPYSLTWRVGVGIPQGNPLYFRWPLPRPGWRLNWRVGLRLLDESGRPYFRMDPPGSQELGMVFAPMVRIQDGRLVPDAPSLKVLARRNPGRLWFIGNEPDVVWQDNVLPQVYARLYRQAYRAIKAGDPTAQVAIGGISQVTPLRLAYLERIWESYREQFGEEMPVDVWNMHAFVLQERRDDWGVGIPPGFPEVSEGVGWGVQEHDSLALVENQVRLMRTWMARHGQREKPLVISEYGILMPPEYGFPPGRVIRFLVGSFDLFRQLQDPERGYPPDDNRLVQRWVWFSSRYDLYPAGDLFDEKGEPTPIMRSLSGYLGYYGE